MSTEHVAGKFRRKGWLVADLGKHICPACRTKKAAKKKDEALKEEVIVMAAATERSPAAVSKLPELYMILGDAYDPMRKNYKEGWSDERIAKETGLSPDFVAKRREVDFGPVKDTTLEDLSKQISAYIGSVDEIGISSEVIRGAVKELQEKICKTQNLGAEILKKMNTLCKAAN